MGKKFTIFVFSALWVGLLALSAQARDNSLEVLEKIDIQRMMKDIVQLSSAQLEGRQAGTFGGRKSADIVQKRLESLGVVPGGNFDNKSMSRSWFQSTSIPITRLRNRANLTFSLPFNNSESIPIHPTLGSDFLPILDSPSVNIMAPVAFVGYGIDDPARGVNDYEGIDVQNRIVMFFKGKPTKFSPWVTHEEKEQTARRRGAAGFITLTGPILNRYEASRGMGHAPLAMYSSPPDQRPLPGLWINKHVGDTLFESQGLSLLETQVQLNELRNQSKELKVVADFQWESTREPGTLINVLGAIPGSDPILREEIVIVGAHRDHFGKQAGLLFPGADDNASGTALLLETARIMTEPMSRPKRTIVFASFSGEERGLLGAKLYVKNPSFPLNKTVAMINVDHVGVGNGKLTVGITRLPKSIGEQAAKLSNLEDKTKFYGYFPGGDHVPLYEAKVPTVTVVSAGKHPSFHQASDTSEKIQPEILQYATRYVLALTCLLANNEGI